MYSFKNLIGEKIVFIDANGKKRVGTVKSVSKQDDGSEKVTLKDVNEFIEFSHKPQKGNPYKSNKMKKRTLYRSAETGRIVTREFAEQNPNTTVKETIEIDGAYLIAQERAEQIYKHGRTVESDSSNNRDYQLTEMAKILLSGNFSDNYPSNWEVPAMQKMLDKPYRERLIIAGALIAAEIDRVDHDAEARELVENAKEIDVKTDDEEE